MLFGRRPASVGRAHGESQIDRADEDGVATAQPVDLRSVRHPGRTFGLQDHKDLVKLYDQTRTILEQQLARERDRRKLSDLAPLANDRELAPTYERWNKLDIQDVREHLWIVVEKDAPRLVASSAAIQRDLGWQPQHPDLRDIVASAWEWHQAHPRGYEAI